jgi:hypothetical protein
MKYGCPTTHHHGGMQKSFRRRLLLPYSSLKRAMKEKKERKSRVEMTDDDDVIDIRPSLSQPAHYFRAQIHEWNSLFVPWMMLMGLRLGG